MTKLFNKIDKEQYNNFKKAWLLQHKIIKDVGDLAEMNISLAYGAVRTAESVVDAIFINSAIRKDKPEKTQNDPPIKAMEEE